VTIMTNERKGEGGSPVRRLLLGLGFDCRDGELRLTKGPNFRLIGGSHATHERMQETCIRFNEVLKRRGVRFEELKPEEAREILKEVDGEE
jgi:hypothetical protein